MSSIIGIVSPQKAVVANPCAVTLDVGAVSAADLASLQAAISGSLTSAEQQVLNALNIPALKGLLSSINGLLSALKTPIPMGLTVSTPGIDPFASIVESIIGKLINEVISSVEQQVLNEVTQIATQAITQAINSLANTVASDLRKDLSPVINVINQLQAVVGKVEATKALVQSILSEANTCPAKAAIMAEAYFKQGAR
jgi:hypothetical protein